MTSETSFLGMCSRGIFVDTLEEVGKIWSLSLWPLRHTHIQWGMQPKKVTVTFLRAERHAAWEISQSKVATRESVKTEMWSMGSSLVVSEDTCRRSHLWKMWEMSVIYLTQDWALGPFVIIVHVLPLLTHHSLFLSPNETRYSQEQTVLLFITASTRQ